MASLTRGDEDFGLLGRFERAGLMLVVVPLERPGRFHAIVERVEDCVLQSPAGEFREEAPYGVDPGARGRRWVERLVRVPRRPFIHHDRLMHDDVAGGGMNIGTAFDALGDMIEKRQELLGVVPLHRLPHYIAGGKAETSAPVSCSPRGSMSESGADGVKELPNVRDLPVDECRRGSDPDCVGVFRYSFQKGQTIP